MDSCLLCLEIYSDKLNCIRTDSKRWLELNVANTVEKHFWPLNTIRFNSFICSPCWRLVDNFHKFYLRVEEAHMKFIIKVENENINDFDCQKAGTDQSNDDADTAEANVKNEPLDVGEDMESVIGITCKHIIEGRQEECFSRKRKCSVEKLLKAKRTADDLNDSENAFDIDEVVGIDSQSDTNSSEYDSINTGTNFYTENDKLILDFLKQINCNICKIQVEDFSTLRKHFLESHQQKAYLLCCNRKFFRKKDLADHIHCHLNPNYFRCGQCNKLFSHRIFLEQHKCEHSSNKFSHLSGTETTNFYKKRDKLYMSFASNDFEDPLVENIPEINATNHSFLPHTTCTDFSESPPLSKMSIFSKNDVKTEEMLAVLKELMQGQKECNTRLKKLEQNQTKMLHDKNLLSNGQVIIVNNQQRIADSMGKLIDSIVLKPEMATQSKPLTDCKVTVKKIVESACCPMMSGMTCDNSIKEVASMLPLRSLAAVQEVEQKLDTPDFAQAMIFYLHKVKGTSEDVSSVIRAIFTDDLLEKFNWEGRWEKQSLGKLMLFNKTLRDVFQHQKAFEFEKSVRKAVERSHHRMNQKKYLKKETK